MSQTPDLIDAAKLTALPPLLRGAHEADSGAMCMMEAVAYVAGEPWSDKPQCVSRVIAEFCRIWNDHLPTDADRDRLLKPLIPEVIGTRTGHEDDATRTWLAADWLIRVYTPAWLRLAGMEDHADRMASLAPIASTSTLNAAESTITAAWDAAQAAWDVAQAAWDVARAAAWVASMDAAWTAAQVAAWVASMDAAGAAARAATWDAAARGIDLAPTVAVLQASAQDLVRRMCAVGRSPVGFRAVCSQILDAGALE